MTKYEPLDPILEVAGAYTKTWLGLSRELRRLIEERAWVLASRSIPPATAIAIVANPTPTIWGAWQYSFDDGVSWKDVPVADLGDENADVADERAIVLSCLAHLRFTACKNWHGTPRDLTIRLWIGCGPVQSNVQDISASIGNAGPWSVDLLELGDAGRGRVAIMTELATGATWDAHGPEWRKATVQDHDNQTNPAFAEQGQRAFDLVGEITELKQYRADQQRANRDGLPPSEITHRRDQLATMRGEIEAKELQLKQLVDGTTAAEIEQTTSSGSDAVIRAVINAIKAAGKQLKRSDFDRMVDELAKPLRGQKMKERERLWREVAPDAWRAEGQGTPAGDGKVIGEWEHYLPKK